MKTKKHNKKMHPTGSHARFLEFYPSFCYARRWQVVPRPAGDLGRSTVCDIMSYALSVVNICSINPKYTKAAISNSAVTSGITGLRKAYFVEKKTSGKHDFHNNFLRLFTF